ncbi:MAG: glycosyltransferase family 2 protein [Lachnospiraceae bacterium]|nr:glycosyltransferase family 2 protein [Lachnospiraceae bacterium]
MSKENLVTIIIPIYNGQRHIRRAVKSVYAQDYKDNIELILINDGSSDESQSIIDDISKRSPSNIDVIVKHEINHGVSYTRNMGIDMAGGRYIMFIDQDDFIAKDYVSTYIKAIESGEYDIVVGGYERIDYTGKILRRVKPKQEYWSHYLTTAPWAHIYRREFLFKHNIHFADDGIGEDIYFNLTALSHTQNLSAIAYAGYKWFYNESSVSNSRQNTIDDKINPLSLLKSIYNDSTDSFKKSIYTEYFMARYACWYMLFASRGSRRADIKKRYSELHSWLKENYPNYTKNPYLWFKHMPGERPKFHIFVIIYYSLFKLHLMLPVLLLFGKNK